MAWPYSFYHLLQGHGHRNYHVSPPPAPIGAYCVPKLTQKCKPHFYLNPNPSFVIFIAGFYFAGYLEDTDCDCVIVYFLFYYFFLIYLHLNFLSISLVTELILNNYFFCFLKKKSNKNKYISNN